MRVSACLMLVAVLAAGCSGENLKARPATDADTAGLPQEERNYVSCLRKVGIKVRVPASTRKLAAGGDYDQRTSNGGEGGFFLFFYLFDKRQRLTKEQIAAAGECGKAREATPAESGERTRERTARERVDALGVAEPEIQRLGDDQVSVALPGAGPARFSPKLRAIYERETAACEAFPPKRLARRYGMKHRNRVLIAQSHSDKTAGSRAREAAFEGASLDWE